MACPSLLCCSTSALVISCGLGIAKARPTRFFFGLLFFFLLSGRSSSPRSMLGSSMSDPSGFLGGPPTNLAGIPSGSQSGLCGSSATLGRFAGASVVLSSKSSPSSLPSPPAASSESPLSISSNHRLVSAKSSLPRSDNSSPLCISMGSSSDDPPDSSSTGSTPPRPSSSVSWELGLTAGVWTIELEPAGQNPTLPRQPWSLSESKRQ